MFDQDEDLEMMDDYSSDSSESVAAQETPFQEEAKEGEAESLQTAPSADAPQPNAAREEATPDPEFKNETVVKDYKSWQRLNSTLAEITGKDEGEVKAMPFQERMNLLSETHKALNDKLASLSEYENFIGLKVDAPADRWDVAAQLNEFPENHLNKLVDTVMKEHLPTLVNESLADPQSHPEEFQLLDGVLTSMLEKSVGRESADIAAILNLTQGISPQQLYQLLQGQGTGAQGAQGGYSPGYPAPQPAQQVSQSAFLMQEANSARAQAQALVNAGWEAESPEVAAWLTQERSLRYAATQAVEYERQQQELQQRIAGIESQLTKSSETEAQKSAQQIDAEYDSKAAAARNGALDDVLKGRVDENDKGLVDDVRAAVKALAEETLRNNAKAQSALADAKAWHKDKAEAKARGEMAKYVAAVSLAYKQAASTILNKFVVPKTNALRTADKRKAARREIGLTGQARPSGTTPATLPRIVRDEDVGDAVVAYYRQQQGAQ